MPYKSNDDLPPSVKDNLPGGAQDVYRNAFNFAVKSKGFDDAKASQYAWGAVSRIYTKKDGKWVKKGTEEMSLTEEDLQFLSGEDLLAVAVRIFGESLKPSEWKI